MKAIAGDAPFMQHSDGREGSVNPGGGASHMANRNDVPADSKPLLDSAGVLQLTPGSD